MDLPNNIAALIAAETMTKLTIVYGEKIMVIPHRISLIESVKEAVTENIPEFGLDNDKTEVYLLENDKISMSFRCSAERHLDDATRLLFVMVRDFTRGDDVGKAVQGCVWQFWISPSRSSL